jgi:NAD dependent epimerase/dehydratase family enzyme
MHWIITTGNSSGTYNLTAPTIDTQLNFHKALQQFSKTPNIAPAIPEWVFTCLLGESAQMVTRGNAVAPKGLLDTGFVFEYTDLKNALSSLLNRV